MRIEDLFQTLEENYKILANETQPIKYRHVASRVIVENVVGYFLDSTEAKNSFRNLNRENKTKNAEIRKLQTGEDLFFIYKNNQAGKLRYLVYIGEIPKNLENGFHFIWNEASNFATHQLKGKGNDEMIKSSHIFAKEILKWLYKKHNKNADFLYNTNKQEIFINQDIGNKESIDSSDFKPEAVPKKKKYSYVLKIIIFSLIPLVLIYGLWMNSKSDPESPIKSVTKEVIDKTCCEQRMDIILNAINDISNKKSLDIDVKYIKKLHYSLEDSKCTDDCKTANKLDVLNFKLESIMYAHNNIQVGSTQSNKENKNNNSTQIAVYDLMLYICEIANCTVNEKKAVLKLGEKLLDRNKPKKVVYAHDATSFLNALDNHTRIILTQPFYDISSEDKQEMNILVYKHLEIIGVGEKPVHIYSKRLLEPVLNFKDSENITLKNLKIGHWGVSNESPFIYGTKGDIIKFSKCNNIHIDKLFIYGLGRIGLNFWTGNNITITNSEINNCSTGVFALSKTSDVVFKNCNFKDNKVNNGSLFNIMNSRNVNILDSRIVGNQIDEENEFIIEVNDKRIHKYLFRIEGSYNIALTNTLIQDNKVDYLVNSEESLILKDITYGSIDNEFRLNALYPPKD